MDGFLTPEQRSSRIKRAMKAKGLNYYKLGKLSGMDCNVIVKMLEKPSHHMKVGSLMRIAAALGVSAGFLVDRRLPSKGE